MKYSAKLLRCKSELLEYCWSVASHCAKATVDYSTFFL